MNILEIVLLGFALSMDAFAVSITDGLTYQKMNKRKSVFIAFIFGFMQGLMPLIGFWIVQLATKIVGAENGTKVGNIVGHIVSILAFALLLFIGIRMLVSALKEMKKPIEEKKSKNFSYREVLYFGLATSIDALGTGVALHSGISNTTTIWLHGLIICVITFIISLLGVLLGHQFEKLFKGKYEITGIIGGSILNVLAFWILLSHFLG